jgi:hypothetical protein
MIRRYADEIDVIESAEDHSEKSLKTRGTLSTATQNTKRKGWHWSEVHSKENQQSFKDNNNENRSDEVHIYENLSDPKTTVWYITAS